MNDAAPSNVVALRPTTESRTVRTRSENDAARGRKHLTRDEVHQLIKAARKSRHGLRDALMIRLTFEHGLRVSELVALKWQHFDLNGGHTMAVQRVKGSLDGTHNLQGETVRALKRYRDATGRGHGYLFVNERGAPVSIDGFRKLFHRLSEKTLGMKWHPHALRRPPHQQRHRHPHGSAVHGPRQHPEHRGLHHTDSSPV